MSSCLCCGEQAEVVRAHPAAADERDGELVGAERRRAAAGTGEGGVASRPAAASDP